MVVSTPEREHPAQRLAAGWLLNAALLWFLFALGLRLAGFFTAWLASLALIPAMLLGTAVARSSHLSPLGPAVARWEARIVFIVLAPIYLSSPGEFLSGRWDPGVYLAQGHAAAQHAGIAIPDRASAALDAHQKALLYGQQRGIRAKHPGFYAADLNTPDLQTQFLPLYPALLAAAVWVGGLPAALRVDGLLYLASALILARTAMRLSRHRMTFYLAAFLFAAHPICIWFGRFHTSESLALFLFCVLLDSASGLCLEAQRHDHQIRFALASLLLPWSTPAAVPVAVVCALFALTVCLPVSRRILLAASGTAGFASVFVFLTCARSSYGEYILDILPAWGALAPRLAQMRLLPVCLIALMAIALVIILRSEQCRARLASLGRSPWMIITGTVGLLGAAWFLRSLFTPASCAILSLISPALAAWALVGFLRLWHASQATHRWLIWAVSAAVSITILFWLWPLMPVLFPWVWKRWIWALLPVAALLAAAGLATREGERRPTRVARWLCAALLCATPIIFYGALLRGGEWHGFHSWIRQVAVTLPKDAIVLAPDEIGTPLEYLFGQNVIPFPSKPKAHNLVALAQLIANNPADRPLVIIANAPPAHLGYPYRRLQLPLYDGECIEQIKLPGPFHRQPRRYDLTAWIVIRDTQPTGVP